MKMHRHSPSERSRYVPAADPVQVEICWVSTEYTNVQFSVSLYIYKYICKRVHLQSKLQQPETWSASSWPHRRPCYRSAIFFLTFVSIKLSSQQGKLRRTFKLFYCLRLCKSEIAWLKILSIRGMSVCVLTKIFSPSVPDASEWWDWTSGRLTSGGRKA